MIKNEETKTKNNWEEFLSVVDGCVEVTAEMDGEISGLIRELFIQRGRSIAKVIFVPSTPLVGRDADSLVSDAGPVEAHIDAQRRMRARLAMEKARTRSAKGKKEAGQ